MGSLYARILKFCGFEDIKIRFLNFKNIGTIPTGSEVECRVGQKSQKRTSM